MLYAGSWDVGDSGLYLVVYVGTKVGFNQEHTSKPYSQIEIPGPQHQLIAPKSRFLL